MRWSAVTPDLRISPPTPDIGFVHRRDQDADLYLLINTGPTTRTFGIAPRTGARSYERWDALSGRVREATDPLSSPPHTTPPLLFSLPPPPSPCLCEPAQPVDLPHIWEDEPGRENYSGAATYTTSIDLGSVDGRAWIDFGDCEVMDAALRSAAWLALPTGWRCVAQWARLPRSG